MPVAVPRKVVKFSAKFPGVCLGYSNINNVSHFSHDSRKASPIGIKRDFLSLLVRSDELALQLLVSLATLPAVDSSQACTWVWRRHSAGLQWFTHLTALGGKGPK